MRTLLLLTYYYPHWTGLTQYAIRLAEALAQRNSNHITVLTTNHTGILKTEEKINKVSVIRKPILFQLSRTLISVEFLFSFYSYIKNNDVIIIYLPFAEVIWASLIARLLHKKLFLVHNGDLQLPKGIFNTLLELFYEISTYTAIKLSNGIIVQTQDYANHSKLLEKHTNKQIVILPLYPTFPVTAGITKKLTNKLPPEKSLFIGFAGRFVEEKGFDLLLEAVPKVLEKYPQAHFVYAGETNISYEQFFQMNKHLIDRYKKHITFLGKLTQEQMPSFYKLTDIIVIPSRSDCFPSVEVEALLNNVPVVVTNIAGARWPVKVTGLGVVVKPQDPTELAQGIIKALQMKDKLKKNHSRAKNIFNWGKTLKKYEETFA